MQKYSEVLLHVNFSIRLNPFGNKIFLESHFLACSSDNFYEDEMRNPKATTKRIWNISLFPQKYLFLSKISFIWRKNEVV